jgi:hypothetical protein
MSSNTRQTAETIERQRSCGTDGNGLKHRGYCRLLISAIIVAAAALGPASARPLYPDFQTESPTHLSFDVVKISGANHDVLRLTTTVDNFGKGRGEFEGEAASNRIYQNIYDAPTGGNQVAHIFLGNIGIYHPVHMHYHIKFFALYTLLDAATNTSLGHGAKTSFCIEDVINRSSPYSAKYTKCTNTDVQGISVGWADVYKSTVADQWVDLGRVQRGAPPLPNGNYVLRSKANYQNKFYEGPNKGDNTGNNTGKTCFAVFRGAITDTNPGC